MTAEVEPLESTVCLSSELQSREGRPPPAPPKPRVVIQRAAVDVAGLEQTLTALRAENVELQKQVTESQGVIAGLRRDLAGASARLSDITGAPPASRAVGAVALLGHCNYVCHNSKLVFISSVGGSLVFKTSDERVSYPQEN